MMLSVAILAGGMATRLRPITEKTPKSLVEIAGKPFIMHQLRLLRRNNVDRVVICAGYLGEKIVGVIGNGGKFGLQVDYSFDGPDLLGTGGAIKKALPLLGDAFFVLYGDSYLNCDYSSVQMTFEICKKPALITVFRNENKWGRSNVQFVNNNVILYDKKNHVPGMCHIDYGLGVLKRSIFEYLSEGVPFDLGDIYNDLSLRGELAGFEVRQRFFEIGSIEGLEDFKRFLDRGASSHDKKGL